MDDECKKAFGDWCPKTGFSFAGKPHYTETQWQIWQAAWELRQPETSTGHAVGAEVIDDDYSQPVVDGQTLGELESANYEYGFQDGVNSVTNKHCILRTDKRIALRDKIAQAPLRDELQALRQQLERAEAALRKLEGYGSEVEAVAREALQVQAPGRAG